MHSPIETFDMADTTQVLVFPIGNDWLRIHMYAIGRRADGDERKVMMQQECSVEAWADIRDFILSRMVDEARSLLRTRSYQLIGHG
jgi:hypothetical protein